MGLKIVFNPKAMESLAKELRRASWGVAVTAGAGGIQFANTWVLIVGGSTWLILQIAAAILESIKDDRSPK
jgi:hypothetical protein